MKPSQPEFSNRKHPHEQRKLYFFVQNETRDKIRAVKLNNPGRPHVPIIYFDINRMLIYTPLNNIVMEKQTFEISVLKADYRAARELAKQFLDLNGLEARERNRIFIEKPVTENKETGEQYKPNSFIIRYVRLEDETKGITIFRYLVTEPGARIEWDKNFITI